MLPAGRTRRRSRGRRKKQKNTGRIVFCTFVEVIVIAALVILIGWDKGVGPAGRTRRRSRGRRKKQKNTGRIVFCTFVEVIVIAALVILIGWDKGVGAWLLKFSQPVVKELDISGIQSPYAVLMQANSGKILGSQGAEERIYPASMTKMMTAILAIEEIKDLDQEIALTQEMFAGLYEQNATQAGFQPGENVRAIDLVYGVLLPSGAECCIALADYISGSEEAFVELMNEKAAKIGMKNTHFCDSTGLHNPEHYSTVIALADYISGSEEAFVELMNEKAAKIGMKNTHFCDSTGLHNPEHYSTVLDMAVLLKYALRNDTFREIIEASRHSTGITNIKYALRNDTFREIIEASRHSTGITNIHPDGITYYSTMFKNLSSPAVTGGEIKGGKTGYTSEAGLCLASFAEIEGREYILVTAGAAGGAGAARHVQDAVEIYNRLGETILSMENSTDT